MPTNPTPTNPTPTNLITGSINLADLPIEILEHLLAHKKAGQPSSPVQQYQARVDSALPEMMALAKDASDYLREVKVKLFTITKELLTLKYAAYGIQKTRSKYLDEQRTHTFSNDKDSISVGYNITEGWGADADIGVAKINEFLHSLIAVDPETGKENPEVRALVDLIFGLLRKNKHGNLKYSSLDKLEKMMPEFNNALFNEGVRILKEQFQPKKTVWFVEAATKNGINETIKIPLSMSAVPFPEDFVFEFLPKADAETDA